MNIICAVKSKERILSMAGWFKSDRRWVFYTDGELNGKIKNVSYFVLPANAKLDPNEVDEIKNIKAIIRNTDYEDLVKTLHDEGFDMYHITKFDVMGYPYFKDLTRWYDVYGKDDKNQQWLNVD